MEEVDRTISTDGELAVDGGIGKQTEAVQTETIAPPEKWMAVVTLNLL